MTLVAAFALLSAGQGAANLNDHSLGAFKLDAVELIERKAEKPGQDAIYADRYGYRYLFANDANRKAFLTAPDRYEIQLGGGCGSMGPLSGRGSVDRYAVYGGRIYLFASDGCRTRFLSNAEKLIDRDAPHPAGDPTRLQAGKALIEKAVAWCGGPAKVDATHWYRETVEEDVESGAAKYHHVETLAVQYAGSMAMISKWNASVYGNISTPTDGFFTGSGDVSPMHPVQRRAMERVRDMKLLSVLRARKREDFVARVLPADRGLAKVEMWFGGSAATLTVDARTGKPISLRAVGRGAGALIGEIGFVYTEFSDIGGLRLPVSWEATFEGKPNKALSATRAAIALGGTGISFARPPAKN